MEPKFKIVLINHSFQINYFSRRWELFAEAYPNVDVTLLAPGKYEWYNTKDYTFGNAKTIESYQIDKTNFHRLLFNTNDNSGWKSKDYKRILLDIRPDIVYFIGIHNQGGLFQILKIRDRYLPKTKVISFSMRGPSFNVKLRIKNVDIFHKVWRLFQYQKSISNLHFFNKHIDAVFCHYPGAVDCFRDEGYKGPIYMQTQVGVNSEWFYPNNEWRQEIRNKYNIGDAFLFGSATRFTEDKGVDDILRALPEEGNWKYFLMGSGTDEQLKRISNIIDERKLQGKVILTGFVDWYDMPKYWNAVDCAVHVPRTTENWVETFSLSAVQPQAICKPVICNDSGSLPYQIGIKELITEERNIGMLHNKLCFMIENKDEAEKYGKMLYNRCSNCFTVNKLNDLFYLTILDILEGKTDPNKQDMTKFFNYVQQV